MDMYACLFDIDGTLIHTGGAGQLAMTRTLADAFGLPPDTDGVSFAGRTDRAIIGDIFRMHGIDDSAPNWQRFRREYLVRLDETLPAVEGKVLAGVCELLETLATRDDVAVGLLTGNLKAGAWRKLEFYGLAHYFQFGSFGDDHVNRDDVAAAALTEICRHTHGPIEPARVWVVGDTPSDVTCAQSIGAGAVAVVSGWHSREELAAAGPDLLLDDLTDVTELLDRFSDAAPQ